jgi:hypothetical protein
MPRAAVDFRLHTYDTGRVESSGRYIGRNIYWKLYFIENAVRTVIHSVLTAQVHSNWWSLAVDSKIQQKAASVKADYRQRPWHTTPGSHDIYYVFLKDLVEVMRANSHIFLPIIPEIDQWIAELERIRLPRNVVGHMNWPSAADRRRIGLLYDDIKILVNDVAKRIQLLIP